MEENKNVSDKKVGRPAKGNDTRVTLRLSDNMFGMLCDYGRERGITDKEGRVNLSEVIRDCLSDYLAACVSSDALQAPIFGLNVKQSARLMGIRRKDSADGLIEEIQESGRLMSSNVWCNVAYNPRLYEKPKDRKRIAKELREVSDRISHLFRSLADRVENG